MGMKKLANKLAKCIMYHYRAHGVHINLSLYRFFPESQRFIYQIELLPGTKVDTIFKRASDVGAILGMSLFYPFKDDTGRGIYLAVCKQNIADNRLLKMFRTPEFLNTSSGLILALGYDVMERMFFVDLKQIDHAMYVGAPRSGKSVGLKCLITSLLIAHPASEVNLLIFDIGANSIDIFENVPHLSYPVVKDHITGIYVMNALAKELKRRELCNDLNELPEIVCVIDEYVSFLSHIENKNQCKTLKRNIADLLLRGRHFKIHIVLASQNPKSAVLGDSIENILTRIAFRVARFQTSSTFLNNCGAEKLNGDGDMLYQSMKYPDPIRLQGAFIDNTEIAWILDAVKAMNHDFRNKFVIPELLDTDCDAEKTKDSSVERPEELANVIIWALEHTTVAADRIKEKFSMGNRVNRIMEKLFKMGIISEKKSNQPRKVCPQSVEEICENTLNFLEGQGHTREEIARAIAARNCKADN